MMRQRFHRGLTLVELLLVMAMLSVLLAITVSSLRGSFEDRKLREATRVINAAVARAKARAGETGRPVALVFERETDGLPGDPARFNAVRNLRFAETPPPYAGDVSSARCSIVDPGVPFPALLGRVLAADFNSLEVASMPALLPTPVGLVEGETAYSIKLSLKGELFRIVKQAGQPVVQSPGPGVTRLLFLVESTSNAVWETIPVGTTFGGVPFQINRPPAVTGIPPITLPVGVVIDMTNSGMGPIDRRFGRTDQLALQVVFGPNGNVESVNHQGVFEPPVSTLHFLVGTRDNFEPDETPPYNGAIEFSSTDSTLVPINKNLTNPESKWVSIAPLTGNVASEENSWRFFGAAIPPFNPPHYFANSMAEARSLVVGMKSEGGN